jgi:hypothetical protein
LSERVISEDRRCAFLCIAKSFFLVSDAFSCVASVQLHTKKGKRNEIQNSLVRGDGMTLSVNALAAFLSFGFVIAVVLGMI